MSFNLGVSNHPTSRMGGLSSIGVYLYEDVYYRQWITEVALAFYEGRQDEFVWLDLVRQFRNPEKQQILPLNLTKEIIDEIAVLYQEDPIYQVVDKNGKVSKADQELWEEIQEHSRYKMIMDKIDRWCWLLGTVLVKVSFIDPNTGLLVKETQKGQVQLDVLHGGVYDIRHGASPYYITELLIGFGNKFGGFAHEAGSSSGVIGSQIASNIPSPSNYGVNDASIIAGSQTVSDIKQLGRTNRIYWSPTSHKITDNDNKNFEVKNPYGIVPAVPFFNSDPAHYYFLPINEPLIYANHAINMRITDLNHIAKFQSFGVPVLKGVERPTSTRQGRPVDDFNYLKGGSAQSRFGGVSGAAFGAGQFRTFDAGMGVFRDGNADANALGFSLGPDTAVAVGEKGDFKFARPDADINGLTNTIHSITDMVRVNHGLRPKHDQQLPSSGFAILMEKLGVLQNNVRRSRLFKEREQQLFHVIKTLWNTHHNKSGEKKFTEGCRLEVTYKEPQFPVDPKTRKEDLIMEQKLLDSGDAEIISKMYPHLSDSDISKLIKDRRKDRMEQAKFEAEVQVEQHKILQEAGIFTVQNNSSSTIGDSRATSSSTVTAQPKQDAAAGGQPKIDNRAKHAEKSGVQPKKNGDQRGKKEE